MSSSTEAGPSPAPDGAPSPTVHDVYGSYFPEDAAIHDIANRSFTPRGPDMLYDVFAAFGMGPSDLVADVGSRDASYAIALHRRFGCRVAAIDPIPLHTALGRAAVAEAGLAGTIEIVEAGIEAMPIEDGVLGAIWCRDVLNHVDLAAGLRDCARVLRPGGRMLVYQTFATDALEPREAARLYRSMALVPGNMDPARFEVTARAEGFHIAAHDVVDCEWREQGAESGHREPGRDLLVLARLRRREAELVERFGRGRFEAAYGGTLWGVYQFLGKLRPQIYVLESVGDGA